jgi:hypothetical protein
MPGFFVHCCTTGKWCRVDIFVIAVVEQMDVLAGVWLAIFCILGFVFAPNLC